MKNLERWFENFINWMEWIGRRRMERVKVERYTVNLDSVILTKRISHYGCSLFNVVIMSTSDSNSWWFGLFIFSYYTCRVLRRGRGLNLHQHIDLPCVVVVVGGEEGKRKESGRRGRRRREDMACDCSHDASKIRDMPNLELVVELLQYDCIIS